MQFRRVSICIFLCLHCTALVLGTNVGHTTRTTSCFYLMLLTVLFHSPVIVSLLSLVFLVSSLLSFWLICFNLADRSASRKWGKRDKQCRCWRNTFENRIYWPAVLSYTVIFRNTTYQFLPNPNVPFESKVHKKPSLLTPIVTNLLSFNAQLLLM